MVQKYCDEISAIPTAIRSGCRAAARATRVFVICYKLAKPSESLFQRYTAQAMSTSPTTLSVMRRIFLKSRSNPTKASNGIEQNKPPAIDQSSSDSSEPKDSNVHSLRNDPEVSAFLGSINQSYVQRQFRQLARVQRERENFDTSGRFSKAQGKSSWVRNRYSDVIPYDGSRVVLKASVKKFDHLRPDYYINASYVFTPNQSRRYIATQGPMEEFLGEFWLMVWQIVSEGIRRDIPLANQEIGTTIVMLTQNEENGIEKCTRYIPPIHGSQVILTSYRSNVEEDHSHLRVKFIRHTEIHDCDCTEREFQLEHTDDKGEVISSKIMHYQYNGWRDMGAPDSIPHFLNFCERFQKYHTTDTSPIIHCSAGVGRTGVFIALDYLLSAVPPMTSEEILRDPVFETVDELRKWRPLMVVRQAQLDFLYSVFRELVLGDVTLEYGYEGNGSR